MKKYTYLNFCFHPSEPESSPQDVEVIDVTASEINLRWSPPRKPNGIIVVYEVLYKNMDTSLMKNTSTTNIILRDLKPYTLYNISVRSYTRFGHGNQLSSLLSVRTSETGKFFVCCLRTHSNEVNMADNCHIVYILNNLKSLILFCVTQKLICFYLGRCGEKACCVNC